MSEVAGTVLGSVDTFMSKAEKVSTFANLAF